MGARGGMAYADAPTGQVTVVDADRAKAVLAAGAVNHTVATNPVAVQQPPTMAAGPTAAGLVLQQQQQQQQQQAQAQAQAQAQGPLKMGGGGSSLQRATTPVASPPLPVAAGPSAIGRPVGGVPPAAPPASARPAVVAGVGPPHAGGAPSGGVPPVASQPPRIGVNPGTASAGPPPPLK